MPGARRIQHPQGDNIVKLSGDKLRDGLSADVQLAFALRAAIAFAVARNNLERKEQAEDLPPLLKMGDAEQRYEKLMSSLVHEPIMSLQQAADYAELAEVIVRDEDGSRGSGASCSDPYFAACLLARLYQYLNDCCIEAMVTHRPGGAA
jgi:hypothetical protein